jgi:hypothetical protein
VSKYYSYSDAADALYLPPVNPGKGGRFMFGKLKIYLAAILLDGLFLIEDVAPMLHY